MDSLYFNTNDKNALFQELGIPDDFQGKIYESSNDWVLVWIGRVPADYETKISPEGIEYQAAKSYQSGFFFNIYLKGQNNMDYFTQRLSNATLLKEPTTPNSKLL